jgi:hypothetical protein
VPRGPLTDVDGHLADGLAGVQQVDGPGLAGHLSYLGGRVDQAALRGHMRDRDEFDPFVDHGTQRVDVELTVRVVRYHVDADAVTAGCLQEGDGVAHVLGTGRQNAVALGPGQGVERHVPGAGGVLHHRDVVPLGAHQAGQ